MLDDSNVQSRSMLLLLAGNPTNFHSLQTLLRFRNYSAAAAVSSLQHCAAEAVCSIAELCNTLCTSNCVLCAEQSQLNSPVVPQGENSRLQSLPNKLGYCINLLLLQSSSFLLLQSSTWLLLQSSSCIVILAIITLTRSLQRNWIKRTIMIIMIIMIMINDHEENEYYQNILTMT